MTSTATNPALSDYKTFFYSTSKRKQQDSI